MTAFNFYIHVILLTTFLPNQTVIKRFDLFVVTHRLTGRPNWVSTTHMQVSQYHVQLYSIQQIIVSAINMLAGKRKIKIRAQLTYTVCIM